MRPRVARQLMGLTSPLGSRVALAGMLGTALWTYVGYPALLRAVSRRAAGDSSDIPESDLPSMTVLVAALNEEAVITEKINDIREQGYPEEKLQILVAADGSDDATAEIAESLGVDSLWQPERRGKTAAINRAIDQISGEITCLTDANCGLKPGALTAIAAAFADPSVGIVSGAKTVTGGGGRGAGEGMYWRYEAMVKMAESDLGVTMGAPGELLGIRTELLRPIPEGIINDDFYLTCDVLAEGHLAKYAPSAVTYEETTASSQEEFERRTRIAAGTWQSCIRFRALASPSRGWLSVSFLSHRVLRSMVVPAFLPLIWLVSGRLARSSGIARLIYRGQGVAYGAAALGIVLDARALAPFSEFLLVNAAQLRGGFRLIAGRQNPLWKKPARERWA